MHDYLRSLTLFLRQVMPYGSKLSAVPGFCNWPRPMFGNDLEGSQKGLPRAGTADTLLRMQAPLIDNLQYANFSPEIFAQMREGGVDAVHVTIAYHETFREMVLNLERWNRWFEAHPDLIFKGTTGDDVRLARVRVV